MSKKVRGFVKSLLRPLEAMMRDHATKTIYFDIYNYGTFWPFFATPLNRKINIACGGGEKIGSLLAPLRKMGQKKSAVIDLTAAPKVKRAKICRIE